MEKKFIVVDFLGNFKLLLKAIFSYVFRNDKTVYRQCLTEPKPGHAYSVNQAQINIKVQSYYLNHQNTSFW